MGKQTRRGLAIIAALATATTALAADPPDPACSAEVFDAVVSEADTNVQTSRDVWRAAHKVHYTDTDWAALRATARAEDVDAITLRERDSAERVRELRDEHRDAKYHARQVRRDPAIAAAACNDWNRLYGSTAAAVSEATPTTAAVVPEVPSTSDSSDD